MRSPRRSFAPEFKALAVRLVNGGQSLTITARGLDISPQLLRSWVLNANKGHKILTPDCLSASQENELTLLKKENAQLRRENDSMKSIAGYFSRDQLDEQNARIHRAGVNPGLSELDITTARLPEYRSYALSSQLATLSLYGHDSQAKHGAIHACIARQYSNLSKSHRKTADYVLSNMLRAATLPIDQLAIAAGISIATANRFARALGFDSYPRFRAEVVNSLDAVFTPVDYRQTHDERLSNSCKVLPASLNEYLSNIALHIN
jgi:transposase-like protein